jgi:nucleoside-diphosphate-sugar epimerase
VVNIAGGGSVTVNQMLAALAELAGHELQIDRLPEQAGDVRITGGTIEQAARLLGWEPKVGVRDGLAAQYAWQATSR